HVGAAARLREELHPELLALQDGGQVAQLLLLSAELENDGGTRRQGRDLHSQGIFVARELLVEDPLMLMRQALPAVLPREADTGQAGVEQHALNLAVSLDGGELGLVVVGVPLPTQLLGTHLAQVGPDKGPCPLPELLEALQLLRRLHS